MIEKACIFCINGQNAHISDDPADRVIKAYKNWWLVLQSESKRQKTKQAAGMLIVKRHVEVPSNYGLYIPFDGSTDTYTLNLAITVRSGNLAQKVQDFDRYWPYWRREPDGIIQHC